MYDSAATTHYVVTWDHVHTIRQQFSKSINNLSWLFSSGESPPNSELERGTSGNKVTTLIFGSFMPH